WKALKDTELEGLADRIRSAFNWTHTPRPFQLSAISAQLQKKDVLIHAGTGYGKTTIAAGPHAHPSMKGKVTFLVSPLIALQEDQRRTLHEEFKLSAIAINSANEGLTKENLQGIRKGQWSVVIISPEMMLSKIFIKEVLRHREMAGRVLSVVVDEAHVVSHWGSDFRKKYGTLGILRALLPRGTPFVAMSVTMPPRVRKDILAKLQFDLKNFVDLNLGNDRPNVAIVIRAMHHPMNTYRDLKFLIPDGVSNASEIKKTMIYADELQAPAGIDQYLYSLCPKDMQNSGFIRPYSAAFPVSYRNEVMDQFRNGIVRILVCTDAAGMGCNIPDIDIVVQWRLPPTVSAFVQRAGRTARGAGRNGLAVLLVQPSVYEADLFKWAELAKDEKGSEKEKKKKKKSIRQSTTYPKAPKGYSKQRGVERGSVGDDWVEDVAFRREEVPLDVASTNEGLYSLVQSGTCRRKVLAQIY
ncbi:P-loop containing nucleoside triphosphate hydrolase protein, partial [Coprinopsis sp. MPI-PUGE-AT-0042]